MHPKSLALLGILISLASLLVFSAVAHAANYRPIMITFPNGSQPGDIVVLHIPISFVAGFQGMYVSLTPDCTSPVNTWYATVSSYVIVMFPVQEDIPANGTLMVYLCYGDITYQPVMILGEKGETTLTARAVSQPEDVARTLDRWVMINGRTVTSTITNFDETVRVLNFTFRFRVYYYGSRVTVRLIDDSGTVLATGRYTRTGDYSLTASSFETRRVRARYYTSYFAYIYEYGWEATILRPVHAVNETTFTGGSVWLVVASGDRGYIVFDNSTRLVYDGYSVNGTGVGSYFYVLASPDGLAVWGPEGSNFYPDITLSPDNVTVAADAYGYNETSTMSFVLYEGPAPPSYSYIIGGESPVPGSGGGGGGGGGAGGGTNLTNATIYVTVNVQEKTWRSLAVIGGFALFVVAAVLTAYAFVRRGWEFYLASVLAGVSGGYLLSYAGLAREGMITSITILTLASLLFLVENIREVARWLGLR